MDMTKIINLVKRGIVEVDKQNRVWKTVRGKRMRAEVKVGNQMVLRMNYKGTNYFCNIGKLVVAVQAAGLVKDGKPGNDTLRTKTHPKPKNKGPHDPLSLADQVVDKIEALARAFAKIEVRIQVKEILESLDKKVASNQKRLIELGIRVKQVENEVY